MEKRCLSEHGSNTVQLFLDECLSPRIAQNLNAEGVHVAVHPRDFGGLGAPDHVVLSRCVDENLVLVTQNARDFRTLVSAAEIHPGLVILPAAGRQRTELLRLNNCPHGMELAGPPPLRRYRMNAMREWFDAHLE